MERDCVRRRDFLGGVTVSFLFHAALAAVLLNAMSSASKADGRTFMVELMELPLSIRNYAIGAKTELKRGAAEQVPRQPNTASRTAAKQPPAELNPEQTAIPLAAAEHNSGMEAGGTASVTTSSGKGDGGAADATILSYFDAVRLKIERAKKYPHSARRTGVEGEATISFTVKPDGAAEKVKLESSSGSSALDRAALETILRAAPFPVPPDGRARSLSVVLEFRTF